MRLFGDKLKAITFSYDDGVEQDRRLINLFNKYNLKCTFNLNSGIQSGSNVWDNKGVLVRRMNVEGLKELYQGHEIAIHTLTHPHLEKQNIETITNEVVMDKINLQNIFNCNINGMAYPFGTYDDRVLEVLKDNKIKYSRTTNDSENFDIQTNLLELRATCHHDHQNLFKFAEDFIKLEPCQPQIFYVWGHSYEFDVDNNWDMMETFCKLVSNKADIFYGTNSEVLL